jgi:hypothetical protein
MSKRTTAKQKIDGDKETRPAAITINVLPSGDIRRRDNRLMPSPEQKKAMREGIAKREKARAEQDAFIREETKKIRKERKQEEAARLTGTRKPPRSRKPYNPVQLGQPNRERNAKTERGFHEENLAPHAAPPVIRAVERAPLTHPDAIKRATFLDKAIQDAEAFAIFRYFVGTMVADGWMRLGGDENRQPHFVRTEPNSRLPFNERERREIEARDFVNSNLPEASRIDMDTLVQQLMPRDRNRREDQFYLSPVEQGKIIASSSDDRVGKGAYIGNYRKLAQHLCQLYLAWEMNFFKAQRDKKIERKKRIAADLSTGLKISA